MEPLTKEQLADLSSRIAARKAVLADEIRRALARAGMERYADLVGQSSDAADASVATLLRDITQAEVRRDVLEVRDILAAEARMAAGRYGACTECGCAIGYERLRAYPTAKRCLPCQQVREKSGRYGPRPSL